MGVAWAMVPRVADVRFELVDDRHPVHRFVLPRQRGLVERSVFTTPYFEPIDTVAMHGRVYESAALGWCGVVYVASEDESRIYRVLLAAETAIVLVAALARLGGT